MIDDNGENIEKQFLNFFIIDLNKENKPIMIKS